MDHDSHREEKVLPPSSLEGQAKDAMHNAFWDHLKEQLSATPPDFSCALELLKEIKEILLSLLLPRQSRLRSEVEDALAADLLQREAERGDLNIPRLSKCVLSMMTLLCAPVRDEAVQKLDGITDSALLLRGIFQVLGLMKMDMRNYTLQSRQPHLREHSILHERAQFQERLSRPPGPHDQVQLRPLTVLASVLLVASSSCGSVLFGSPQFVDRLKRSAHALTEDFDSRPEEAMLAVSEQVSQEIHQSLKSMGLAPLSSDNTASLMGQLQDIAHAQNCVRSVIDQRIHLFLKCCLVLGVQRSLLDLPGGLSLIEAELAELGQRFVNLTHHNQQVFGPYYTEILKTLIPLGQAPQTGVESL
ncbi:PREDICTED: T-complex protein 11 homolog [Myotis davidii]|uniref:T-complex protein 11 homolog n=1 Tax=Myotis davidii TaxID=225400 RepID=UPI0007677D77|nr:PREDICTED: T-complex protein 11 homolog [Myotis davidii]